MKLSLGLQNIVTHFRRSGILRFGHESGGEQDEVPPHVVNLQRTPAEKPKILTRGFNSQHNPKISLGEHEVCGCNHNR